MTSVSDHDPYREGLAFELKAWLNPSRSEHQVVLVRTLIALRNYGGGSLMIGIENDGTPRADLPKFDLIEAYHPDRIQDLISRHASDRFVVNTQVITIDGRDYVRIDAEAGVRTPVRVKSAITVDRDGRKTDLLRVGEVPVRTLEANGRPSTADCGAADWERLMQTCFDNREADIARFIRRHLGGVGPAIDEILTTIRMIPPDDGLARAKTFLELGNERFSNELNIRQPPSQTIDMLQRGAREVALVILPPPEGQSATQSFLQRMLASVPRLTSYPPWLDTSMGGREAMPNVRQGRWEGLLAHSDRFDALTFEIFDPTGQFYERRLMLPDVIARAKGVAAKQVLGEREALTDVAEVLLTGLEFAKALGVADEHHELAFAFRWSGLDNRIVDDWFLGGPSQYIAVEAVSPVCSLVIPGDKPGSALADDIVRLMAPMFELFRGYQSPPQQAEETLSAVMGRRSPY